ncbi:hypothetical protein, partial [Neoaquamicrobium sediminum]|uniref:hypothetical protein n=1 Tax=Neoaquamicrobium sediminum TaxID=1849104 RepID=UPI0040351DF6
QVLRRLHLSLPLSLNPQQLPHEVCHIPHFPFLWDRCGVRRLWFPVGLLLFNTIPYQSFLKLDVGSVVLTYTLTMDNSQQRISWLSQR